jgi:hypothetical protein
MREGDGILSGRSNNRGNNKLAMICHINSTQQFRNTELQSAPPSSREIIIANDKDSQNSSPEVLHANGHSIPFSIRCLS